MTFTDKGDIYTISSNNMGRRIMAYYNIIISYHIRTYHIRTYQNMVIRIYRIGIENDHHIRMDHYGMRKACPTVHSILDWSKKWLDWSMDILSYESDTNIRFCPVDAVSFLNNHHLTCQMVRTQHYHLTCQMVRTQHYQLDQACDSNAAWDVFTCSKHNDSILYWPDTFC